jgi:hypothetical protein
MKTRTDITIWLKHENDVAHYVDVIDAYQHGLMYRINRKEGDTIEIPIENIWYLVKEYEET